MNQMASVTFGLKLQFAFVQIDKKKKKNIIII